MGIVGVGCALGGASTAEAEWTLRGSLLFDAPKDLKGSGSEVARAAVDNGVGYAVALGYDLLVLRVEAEAMYLKSKIGSVAGFSSSAKGDLQRYAAFGNAYLDFPVLPFVDGYIGGGVGISRLSLDLSAENPILGEVALSFSDTRNSFGMQAMAGLRFEIRNKLNAQLGYRYVIFEEAVFKGSELGLSTDSGEHVFEASFGFGF